MTAFYQTFARVNKKEQRVPRSVEDIEVKEFLNDERKMC